ncbi:MAG: TIGR03016 family PEP-CTERM system-associated outer membrane protein, partial [Acetobacteraceae bacterium]
MTTPAPPVGVSVRLGDVGELISAASAVGATPLAGPGGLTIVPSLGVSEEFNSNIFNTARDQRSDFITSITPGILVNLATPSATGTLSYSPTVQIYAKNSSQNNVAQNLLGSLDAILLPQTLLLSVQAYSSQGSSVGGLAPGGASVTSSQNRVTTTAFSVTPTFQHRFGDIGTLGVTYSLQYSNENGNAATAPGATQPFFTASHSVTNQGTAQFTTGPFLGRFNNTISASAASETGTGVLDGAHQYVVSNTLRFALQRRVYIFGTVGYENIFYPSVPEVKIEDGIWAIGVHLTPGPATSITAGYGHLEGFNSPFLNVAIALSPRTTLAASYS